MPAFPTLSQIKAWDIEHLSRAATYWRTCADVWERSFDQVTREMSAPGGAPWCGRGAEAAQRQATADGRVVREVAGHLRVAAATADGAADELAIAKKSVLLAVGEAEANGFVVGEDLALTDRERGAMFPAEFYARRAQAEALAAVIRERTLRLVSLDEKAAGQVSAAVGAFELHKFGSDKPGGEGDHSIRLVDARTFREGPVYPEPGIKPGTGGPGPAASAAAIREAIKNLPSGTNPRVFEVRDQEQLRRFADWIAKGGQEF